FSIVDNCAFFGGSTTANTKGILIGIEAEEANEMMAFSKITNCKWNTFLARENELDIGIQIGMSSAQIAGRIFYGSEISDNIIMAKDYGIHLYTGESNNNGSVIARNVIGSVQLEAGAQHGIYSAAADELTKVTDNRISSVEAPITNFATANVIFNVTSTAGNETDVEWTWS
ncbi:unnamed protein product, partial [marine sediment metagenome]